MIVTGYSDRWSAAPGETLRFRVHCEVPSFHADLVRLIHGDENPRGPGFKEQVLDSQISGDYPGRRQAIHPGSCVIVETRDKLPTVASFTLLAWVWPTAIQRGPSTLIARGDPAVGAGFRLGLDAGGVPEFTLGGETPARLALDRPLIDRDWYLVGAGYDAATGRMRLFRFTRRLSAGEPHLVEAAVDQPGAQPDARYARLIVAASWPDETQAPTLCFNGKIGAPTLFDAAMTPGEAIGWSDAGGPSESSRIAARLDFSHGIEGERIVDAGPHALHGRTHNRPTRGVTGPHWTGRAPGFAQAPDECDAIHFHDDDIGDVGWEESLAFIVPDDLRSGIYAIRLRCAGGEDHLPFAVRPALGHAGAKIAFLMPTLTYLAYSNESLDVSGSLALAPMLDMDLQPERYAYMGANALKSTYDLHTDGSGICHASMHRPVLDFRPRARCRTFDAPHHFPADLHLIDWLATKGFDHDVVTDHDLHADGTALLAPYNVIITGSHPEYWTGAMLDALDGYLNSGGRLMYLGGNGFYWVTAVDPQDASQIEVRRWTGTRSWQAEPGEFQISLTGEMGGLWRDRGRAPQKMLGVGFTGQGFDRGSPYVRGPASHDPQAAFIFDGVDSELVGDGPALVLNHGAGGFEVDKANRMLGTPAHTIVLASTRRHSDAYQYCVEEILAATPDTGGHTNRNIGADIALLHYPNGGAVFSVGSISWTSTLSANGYAGDTSRITENVLRAFAMDELPSDTAG